MVLVSRVIIHSESFYVLKYWKYSFLSRSHFKTGETLRIYLDLLPLLVSFLNSKVCAVAPLQLLQHSWVWVADVLEWVLVDY